MKLYIEKKNYKLRIHKFCLSTFIDDCQCPSARTNKFINCKKYTNGEYGEF